eukprot:1927846-Amphidinium_carterae.3
MFSHRLVEVLCHRNICALSLLVQLFLARAGKVPSSCQDRILRKEGARLVRFRWYGENTGDPNTEVYVERKVGDPEGIATLTVTVH